MSFFKDVGKLGRVAQDAGKQIVQAGKEGLFVAGEHVLGVSNSQVPHEDGDLERSGAVSQEDGGRTAISYDTDYAVVQHEDESLKHDAGRNAKFLENALNSEREAVLQIVAQAIKGRMGT